MVELTWEGMSAEQRMVTARMKSVVKHPYFASGLFAMRVREEKRCPTMGVDKHWRLYYNADYVNKLSLDKCVAVYLHELYHLLRGHHDRLDARNHNKFNIASDMEINDDIENLPDNCYFPKTFKLEDGQPAEWYYERLPADMDKCPNCGGDMSKEDNPGGSGGSSGEGGGCTCQGIGKDLDTSGYEAGDDGTKMDKAGGDCTKRSVAAAIKDAESKNPGSTPAGLVRWADTRVAPPKVRWENLLRKSIQSNLIKVSGCVDYTYAKPSRTHRSKRIIFPAMVGYKCKVACVVDTSGSVNDTQLKAGMAEVFGIAKSQGIEPVLISCDAAAHLCTNFRRPEMIGGGGTDMGVGIAAALKAKAKICVVLTDGYTPWPSDAPRGMRVIVCMLPGDKEVKGPSWAETIYIDE